MKSMSNVQHLMADFSFEAIALTVGKSSNVSSNARSVKSAYSSEVPVRAALERSRNRFPL